MKAVILEKKDSISLKNYEEKMPLGPGDVRIRIHCVGICGSDVHYYSHGKIGGFVVEKPMVLGHEASGVVVETGAEVTSLKEGDRVCMEPGIPSPSSEMVRNGTYNLDPDLTFWATPPVDGCLRDSVVHPAAFTYKLEDSVSMAEGAMIEPLAVGIQAAKKARIAPGDIALVLGAGTIGITTALSALAGGCSKVLIADVKQEKLDVMEQYQSVVPLRVDSEEFLSQVLSHTDGAGADVIFEASGSARAIGGIFPLLRPAGRVVLIGMPINPVKFDIVGAQCREAEIQTVFRYANVYKKALNLVATGKIDLKPLISARFPFDEAVEAFDLARENREDIIKILIDVSKES